MAHSVTQHTKEIGVRIARGAASQDIRRLIFREGMLPVSEDCSARTMALPFHARLGEDDQEYVVEALRAVLS